MKKTEKIKSTISFEISITFLKHGHFKPIFISRKHLSFTFTMKKDHSFPVSPLAKIDIKLLVN